MTHRNSAVCHGCCSLVVYRTKATSGIGFVSFFFFLVCVSCRWVTELLLLVCFQAGYFCLSAFSKEIQQLLISTPVTQRCSSQRRGTVALHYIILAHCLDDLKIIEVDERCDSCAFSPQGDVLSQSSLVFRVSQAEREVRNESLNQSGIQHGHRLQHAVDLPLVHAFVLLHK